MSGTRLCLCVLCLALACKSSSPVVKTDDGTTGSVTAAGGRVAVANAASNLDKALVEVPAGALAETVTVTVSRGTAVIPASGYAALSPPITFGPARRLAGQARVGLP